MSFQKTSDHEKPGLIKRFVRIPNLTPKLIVALVFLGGVAGLSGFALLEQFTTRRPAYCKTCHYWQRNSSFWITDSRIHPEKVLCTECHGNHEQIIRTDYSASSDRVNPNCLRCHKKMPGKEDQAGFKFNSFKITISHKFHLTKAGAKCTDCHSNVRHDSVFPQTFRPRMENCFKCHEQGTSCMKCHAKGTLDLPLTTTASRDWCSRCHIGFEDKRIVFEGILFPHKRHLSKEIACTSCHDNSSKHGTLIPGRKAECLSCHHAVIAKRTPCETCHKLEMTFRTGKAMGELKGEPGPMLGVVACNECHEGISQGHRREAVVGKCAACHDASYSALAGKWQQETRETILGLEREAASLDREIGALRPDRIKEVAELDVAKKRLAETSGILQIARSDRSQGVHNFQYVRRLLRDASHKLEEVRELIP